MTKSPKRQEEEIEDRVSPPGEVVYEAIYREGEHELKRGMPALALSGLAAGLSMGFSFLAEALLRSYLPDSVWLPAVTKVGYAVGFVIVILGRQQLFTKNTLTVILPLLNRRGHRSARLSQVARLWGVVLTANLLGAAAFAALMAWPALFPPAVREAFAMLGREAAPEGFWVMLARSVLAGWLIALMIWLLPFAESGRIWVISLLAYVVGLGRLPHVIAGSVDALYAVLARDSTLGHYLSHFLLPVLIGNAIGGVALVAAGAHAEFVQQGASGR